MAYPRSICSLFGIAFFACLVIISLTTNTVSAAPHLVRKNLFSSPDVLNQLEDNFNGKQEEGALLFLSRNRLC
jgi:hypothetical protein